jgi:hypothetical protein
MSRTARDGEWIRSGRGIAPARLQGGRCGDVAGSVSNAAPPKTVMTMTRVVSSDAAAHLFSIGENQSGREHQQTSVSVTVLLCPTAKELGNIHAPLPLAGLHLPTGTDLGTTTFLACSQYERTAGLPEDERMCGSLQEVQGHTLEHLSLSLCRWVSERARERGKWRTGARN